MPDPWFPTPATTQPTPQQLEALRDACLKLLDEMFSLFWHAGVIGEAHDSRRVDWGNGDASVPALLQWASIAVERLMRLQELLADADAKVRLWAFHLDRFASETLTVAHQTYPNTPAAVVGVVGAFMGRVQSARTALTGLAADNVLMAKEARTLARLAHEISSIGIEVIGGDIHAVYSRLRSQLRVEMAKAIDVPQAEGTVAPPALAFEEQAVLDALEKHGKRLTRGPLLQAAGLNPDNSNHFAMLALLRQKKLIDNDRDARGRGYGLPQWKRS